MEETYIATVEKIIGRTGSRGAITQVKVSIETGSTRRTLHRNVRGPVKEGDKIVLLECEREARRMR